MFFLSLSRKITLSPLKVKNKNKKDFRVLTPFDIHYNSIHGQRWEMWYIPIALFFSCIPFSPISVFCCETRLDARQCHLGSCLWGIRTKRERKVTLVNLRMPCFYFLQLVKWIKLWDNKGTVETLSEINRSGGFRTGSRRVLRKSLLWKKKLMKVIVQYLM